MQNIRDLAKLARPMSKRSKVSQMQKQLDIALKQQQKENKQYYQRALKAMGGLKYYEN